MATDIASRVARLEALDSIRQLAARYAQAVDTRNLDALVELFVEDVRVGRSETGRPALRAYFDRILRRFTTSIHLIGNHVIDFDDDDHAHGVVYCRPEHEIMDKWVVMTMQYWDTYERRDGRWYFVRRRPLSWYAVDSLERPGGEVKLRWPDQEPNAGQQLPAAWPSWNEFWAGHQPT